MHMTLKNLCCIFMIYKEQPMLSIELAFVVPCHEHTTFQEWEALQTVLLTVLLKYLALVKKKQLIILLCFECGSG